MNGQLQLNLDITHDFASEIEKESAFVSPYLAELTVDPSERIVRFRATDPARLNEVEKKVATFLHSMLAGYREAEPRVVFQTVRNQSRPIEKDVFGKLQEQGWLHEVGPGHVSLAGPPLRFIAHLDSVIQKIYEEQFAAIERSFPALVPARILAKAGYFDSHPNNVTMTTHLVNDFDLIEKFRQNEGRSGDMSSLSAGSFATPHLCLNPAACLPCYPVYANQDVSEGCALSWKGRVFRYESSNIRGLERLTEFNVRELVLIGDSEYVATGHEKAIAIVKSLCEMLEIEGVLVTATDPFFATVSATKKFWQQSMEAKYEIRLPFEQAANGKLSYVAAGSINHHGTFFGSRFVINSGSEEFANTGCVGLGLERWLLACFAQHGTLPDKWPEAVRHAVFQ